MTDFGARGFATIEPGNGTLEEQVVFTGVTQNSNGTATLTGVSSVLFISPYTQTSGLAKTHAGSVTLVISNTSGFYDSLTGKADDETITGTWTFTNPNYPRMDTATPFPIDNEQLATKAYADSLSFAGAPNASPTQKGIVEIATQAEVDARTKFGSTGAYVVPGTETQRSTLLSDYVVDTSASVNVIKIAPSPVITAYTTGQIFSTKVALTNTSTTPVINVNGLGNKNITRSDGSTPAVGDLQIGSLIVVEYDGTNFEVLTPSPWQVSPTGTPSKGDILYNNGSAWVRLAASASAFLQSGGATSNPQWTDMRASQRIAIGALLISGAGSPFVSGLAFQPSMVSITLGFDATTGATTSSGFSQGYATSSSNQVYTYSWHNVGSGTSTSSTNTLAVVTAFDSGGAVTLLGRFFAMTASGFILDVPTATVVRSVVYVAYQ